MSVLPILINFFFSNHFLGDRVSSYNVNPLSKPMSPPLSKSWWSLKHVYLILYLSSLQLLLNSSVGGTVAPMLYIPFIWDSHGHCFIHRAVVSGFQSGASGMVPLASITVSTSLSLLEGPPGHTDGPFLPRVTLQLSPVHLWICLCPLEFPSSPALWNFLQLPTAHWPYPGVEDTTGRDIGNSLRERSGGKYYISTTLSINPPPYPAPLKDISECIFYLQWELKKSTILLDHAGLIYEWEWVGNWPQI